MEYFFSGLLRGSYESLVDSLLLLKIGKIIGEDYHIITIGYDEKSVEAYDLFICGYLTRGSNAYILKEANKDMVRFISKNSNSERGIFIETTNGEISIHIFNEKGKYIDVTEEKELNYLLSSNISFKISNRLGSSLDTEMLVKDYHLFVENRRLLEDD